MSFEQRIQEVLKKHTITRQPQNEPDSGHAQEGIAIKQNPIGTLYDYTNVVNSNRKVTLNAFFEVAGASELLSIFCDTVKLKGDHPSFKLFRGLANLSSVDNSPEINSALQQYPGISDDFHPNHNTYLAELYVLLKGEVEGALGIAIASYGDPLNSKRWTNSMVAYFINKMHNYYTLSTDRDTGVLQYHYEDALHESYVHDFKDEQADELSLHIQNQLLDILKLGFPKDHFSCSKSWEQPSINTPRCVYRKRFYSSSINPQSNEVDKPFKLYDPGKPRDLTDAEIELMRLASRNRF